MWKRIWNFIWNDDSIASWLVNIVLAFVLIKYIVYPGLGLLLNTPYPIVAVVSNSMYHNDNFEGWWENAKGWYIENRITKEDFLNFPMRNGLNKGDIMILKGTAPLETNIGDIIVFQARKPDPIIHRIVKKTNSETTHYQTKGDNYVTNPAPIQTPEIDETNIPHNTQIIKGKAVFRIPYLGYVKIIALRIICSADILCPNEYKAI